MFSLWQAVSSLRYRSIALLVCAALAVAGGYAYWRARQDDTRYRGFARANGRIELQRFDVAAKLPGRVTQVLAREGDMVQAGTLIATLDRVQTEAQLQAAVANLMAARQASRQAEAEIKARAIALRFADLESRRASQLVGDEAVSQADADGRKAQRDGDAAALAGAEAAGNRARAAEAAAAAQVAQARSVLDDTRLVTPTSGRVEYRLVEPGAVVGPGSQIVTLLDPGDAYMTVFLPTRDIIRLKLGAQARLRLDDDGASILPAHISFIATEAQFTPRTVETESERDKLMYRVKLAIDRSWLAAHPRSVHGGLTGEAFIRLGEDAAWPAELELGDHGR
jgi:HlyD family secretion protein